VLSAAAAVAHESPVIVYGALALSAAAAVTLLAAPSWVEWGIARLRARWGLPAVEIAVHRSATAKFIGLAIVAWIVHCTAFVALAASLASFDLPTASRLAFAYNLAYHVAFFVFIVPGGIGVREGTLTALIAPALGSAAAGVLALVQRFWYMAAELLSFLVALALLRWLAPANSAGTDRANS
jgi:uncharacterized membrane protein YbhN (UPF0104 family)